MSNNKMLIDAGHPEETRVVMVRGNRVDEFDFESEHKTQLRGNIYLAKVTRVEPSLQAAFVDYGGNRHGFLAFSEIHPDYYQIPVADRQALLDAEAEDARLAAAAEAREEQDELDQDDPVDPIDPVEEKPTRKRRSRRRGKKETEATAATGDSTDDIEAEQAVAEEGTAEDASYNEALKKVTAIAGSESDDAEDAEENDDDDNTVAAENDGKDVVSEPVAAKKPARKPRKKKAPAEGAALAEEASADNDTSEIADAGLQATTAATEPPKRTRRRTSRVKSDAKEASAVEAEASPPPVAQVEAQPTDTDEAEKPKPKRRRTSRKKKSDDETAEAVVVDVQAAEITVLADEQDAEQAPEAVEDKPRKSRSRSRSRRRKNSDETKNAEAKEAGDAENGDAVEDLGSEDALEEVPARRAPRRHYKIQEVIKRRQILLVQVVKEERGNKGAALSTYLSLAGRYSVLMPNTARGGGISRKITNAADRKRLKSIASGLEVPQGMGVILRTAGASRQPDDIQRDFEYLMRLWENVRSLTLESTAPCLVYEEGSLIKRSIRDLYDKDTGEILVAGEAGYREAIDFMTMLMPNHAKNVKLYRDRIPMFARMGVEAQLDAMLQPQVTLKSGGYLHIDQTEALVAIDVNSGRSTRQHSIEETATQTNLEAADEVARQLRLRDLAGLIVIDFIDMEDKRNIRAVEKRLKDALKNDRARIQLGRISHFGLMEMSRQRIRASVLESTTQACPTCEGLGHVRSTSSAAISILRSIEEHLNRNSRNDLTVKMSTEAALYVLNNKRDNIGDLENRFKVSISVATDDTLGNGTCEIERGEQSSWAPALESAIQPDSIDPSEREIESEQVEPEAPSDEQTVDGETGGGKKRRRRRRRRKGGEGGESEENAEISTVDANRESADSAESDNKSSSEPSPAADDVTGGAQQPAAEAESERPKRARRSRAKKPDTEAEVSAEKTESSTAETVETDVPEKQPARRRSRRTTAAKKTVADEAVEFPAQVPEVKTTAGVADEAEKPSPKRRTTRRKKVNASTDNGGDGDGDGEGNSNEGATPSEVAESLVKAAAIEPTDAVSAEAEPKKGGWWQRKFF